jgi:hypothetical protein
MPANLRKIQQINLYEEPIEFIIDAECRPSWSTRWPVLWKPELYHSAPASQQSSWRLFLNAMGLESDAQCSRVSHITHSDLNLCAHQCALKASLRSDKHLKCSRQQPKLSSSPRLQDSSYPSIHHKLASRSISSLMAGSGGSSIIKGQNQLSSS